MGAVDLVVQVESPGSVAQRAAADRPRRPPGRRAEPRQDLPEVPRRPARGRGRRRSGCCDGPDRGDALPAQPARRARAADRRDVRGRRVARRRPAGASSGGPRTSPSSPTTCSTRRPRHARRPLPVRRVRGAAAARRLGPGDRHASARARAPDASRSRAAARSPTAGLFGVFLPDGARVGELDEEMVYESRRGEVFVLGASTWRIEEITRDRVVVTPAPGEPGKMPFWKGDKPGPAARARPRARRVHARAPRLAARRGDSSGSASDVGLDELAADEPRALPRRAGRGDRRGPRRPHDRRRALPRRDRRLARLRPLAVRLAGARAVGARDRGAAAERLGPGRAGAVERRRHRRSACPSPRTRIPLDELLFDPDESRSWSSARCPSTALFASRLPRGRRRARCCSRAAARASARRCGSSGSARPTCSRSRPGTRRSRSCSRPPASACATCSTSRRCARCSATSGRGAIAARRRSTPSTRRRSRSRCCSRWIGVYMYEGDAPLAERRAAALALDRDLLRELLGAEELRELLDPAALAELELELQRLADGRRARNADDVHDLLRRLGDLADEIDARAERDDAAPRGSSRSSRERRAIRVRVAGEERLAAVEDAARLRDALGVALPLGLPGAFTEPVERAARRPRRALRAHARPVRRRRGRRAARRRRRRVRRRSTALEARRAASCTASSAPAASSASGATSRCSARSAGARSRRCGARSSRSTPRRSGGSSRRGRASARPPAGPDALVEAIEQLQGAPIPASVLERDVLPGARPRATGRPSSTSCARAASSCGSAPARSGPTTAACALCFRDRSSRVAGAARAGRAARRRAARRDPRAPRASAARRSGPSSCAAAGDRRRARGAGRAVGSRLGRRGHERHARAAPRVRLGRSARTPRAGGRPRPGRAARGRARRRPPGAGRSSRRCSSRAPTPTEVAHARALQLLERHGVVTREAVLAEGVPGGFAGVYGVLQGARGVGQVRRGYFVAGLGAAQFALPGAVDRLRALREPGPTSRRRRRARPRPIPRSRTAPRCPGPRRAGRPARVGGRATSCSSTASRPRSSNAARASPGHVREPTGDWVDALAGLVKDGRLRRIELPRIDGDAGRDSRSPSAAAPPGSSDGYRGLTLRG